MGTISKQYKDNTSMPTWYFILKSLVLLAFIRYMYGMMLFEELPQKTHNQSEMILTVLVVSCYIIGVGLTCKKCRSNQSLALITTTGAGIYSILSYAETLGIIPIIILTLTGLRIVLHMVRFIVTPIHSTARKRIIHLRAVRFLRGAYRILGDGVLLILVVILLRYMRGSILMSDETYFMRDVSHPAELEYSLTELNLMLEDEPWQNADQGVKLRILKEVVAYETEKLGLEPVSVGVCPLRPGVYAEYDDKQRLIRIDFSALDEDFQFQLRLVCHG